MTSINGVVFISTIGLSSPPSLPTDMAIGQTPVIGWGRIVPLRGGTGRHHCLINRA
jgi:hypothetical protein